MTASPGREVDRNLLRGGALGSAQARAEPQDAGGQDLGDLVEALVGRHEIGVEGVTALRPRGPGGLTLLHTDYLPGPESRCRALPPEAMVFGVDDVLVLCICCGPRLPPSGGSMDSKHHRGDSNDVDR
jgi:hypothetical protein